MKPLLFLLALLLCFLAAFVLQAQPTVGLLCGAIADSAGKPVPGAVVTVDTTWQITTQADGTYQIAGIPVGEHQLRISLPGSETAIADNSIMVQGGDTIVKNATLYGSAIRFDLARRSIVIDRKEKPARS